MKNIIIQLIKWLTIAYFAAAALVFAPYYNWKFTKDNSFASWLFLGELIPTLKAVVWPLYLFDEPKSKDSMHAETAMKLINTTTYLIHEKGIMNLTDEERKAVILSFRDAISEAEQVSIEHLEKMKPGLAEQYHGNFVSGMREIADGMESGNKKQMASGCTKMNAYFSWAKAAIK